jgi:hypothetical protein
MPLAANITPTTLQTEIGWFCPALFFRTRSNQRDAGLRSIPQGIHDNSRGYHPVHTRRLVSSPPLVVGCLWLRND